MQRQDTRYIVLGLCSLKNLLARSSQSLEDQQDGKGMRTLEIGSITAPESSSVRGCDDVIIWDG